MFSRPGPSVQHESLRPEVLDIRRTWFQLRKSATPRAAFCNTEPHPSGILRRERQVLFSRARSFLNGDLSCRGKRNPCRHHLTNASRNNENETASLSKLELGSDNVSPAKKKTSYDGIFLMIVLNIGIFVADFWLKMPIIRNLYLYHSNPQWYQFITSTFCHLSWNHLSSNLFFLYIFGKLVEEEEGPFAVWLSYLVTGVGANIVSYMLLPRNIVSAGASGAVFGLFAVSVLLKLTIVWVEVLFEIAMFQLSFDWRKILEVIILGQFVVERVMEAAQASVLQNGRSSISSMNVNHLAHLSGALVGAALIWALKQLPSAESDKT